MLSFAYAKSGNWLNSSCGNKESRVKEHESRVHRMLTLDKDLPVALQKPPVVL